MSRSRPRRFGSTLAVVVTVALAAPAAAAAAFGAIAVNPASETWGKSANFPSKQGAEQAALNECRSLFGGGAGCRVVLSVKGSRCGAVGENSGGTKTYFAFGGSESAAANKIRARHPGAEILAAVCGRHQ